MSSESKRVFLVTGAAGFVGANLCRRLVDMSDQVHVLVKPSTALWRIESILDRLHLHQVDICDVRQVEQAVEAIEPTVIYHLASHGAYHYQDQAEKILLVNVFGLWNLLNSCNRVGYELFVNTGSSSEYGRKKFAMREADILSPNSFYAVAKAGQSLLCQHVAQTSDVPLVTVRPFSVYGPYEEPTRLIPHLMMAALEDRPLDMVSPRTARDFVHVDDVVDIYLETEKLKGLGGEIVNVGTGVQTALSRLVEETEEICGRQLDVRWGQMLPRIWDSDVWVADVSTLYRLTDLSPRTLLPEGLRRCLSWYREHSHFYRGERSAAQ